MLSSWIFLVHPFSGLIVVVFSTIVAAYGWRYRNARLGKSGKDVMETFNLQKVHKYLGITLLTLTVIVWLLEFTVSYRFNLNELFVPATHSLSAIALVLLITTSATIILRFRRRRWATGVHLTLNGFVLALIAVQLLSGLGLLNNLSIEMFIPK